ncbi:MAG: FGGY family carbohydrate kinase, partial [Stackebrandtia sp.]
MGSRTAVVLGLDIGSTNVKAIALDGHGHVVSRVHRPTPRSGTDPSVDAEALFDLLEDIIVEACGDRFAVSAVCAAGVGEDGLLVDAAGRSLGPALAWFDPRRTAVFRDLELPDVDDLGVATDAARTLVGWAWARRQPGAHRARRWLALTDFASCRWARHPFMSDTLAARTAAWREPDRAWAAERVHATLGSTDLLASVVGAGDIVGGLHSARLHRRGVLAAEAVVVAGGHDHPIGGWAVDTVQPGAILDSMGTAEVVVAQSPTPVPPDAGRI